MPGIFDPLDAVKQALMLDASAAMTEAQMYEQTLAEQVARRRRLSTYGGSKDQEEMSDSLASGTRLTPGAYAGLSGPEIADTVAQAAWKRSQKDAENRVDAIMLGSERQDVEDARAYERAHGLPPGSVVTGEPSMVPRPTEKELKDRKATRFPVAEPTPYGASAPTLGSIDRGPDGAARYTPNEVLAHPAVERYGNLEAARQNIGQERFYGALAGQSNSVPDFARVLAGQLTAQRLAEMGMGAPDHADPFSAMLYEDPSKRVTY